ncbi:cytochrome P450 [Pholiota conissans]|uniref:Cytochrome P450 n=1 Tax=Pholiota conissans TaxID=109636 RepID=A0A9P6CS11_9AGAR|nr:cytochrome P450 [Pholiota conissans]
MAPPITMLAIDSTSLALLACAAFVVYVYVTRRRDLDHIPTIGYSDPFLSWISSLRFIFGVQSILEEGYVKYPGGAFKIPMIDGWIVVLNGDHHVKDIARASTDKMNSFKSTSTFLQYKHTLGLPVIESQYHATVIRTSLTRNIGTRFEDIHDQIIKAYDEGIACKGKEWIPVPAVALQIDVICKVASRFFVGKPLCDNAQFRAICEQATLEIYKGRFIRLFPEFMRPAASRIVTNVHGLRAQMEEFVGSMVECRLEQERLHGEDWPEKPNDIISWLMDGAKAAKQPITVSDISSRILLVSFGAIHTSSATFTSALYQLCLSPENAQELRQEIEAVVNEEGWTKDSVSKMYKLDSYFRESQRVHFLSTLPVGRTTLQDFTFSDGLCVPKGTSIGINVYSRHLDENYYQNASEFDAFRHAREDGEGQPLVTGPAVDYHPFGHGRSACPGRFFAATELKVMMAHLIMNYDFKLEKDEYPHKMIIESQSVPDYNVKVFFRKRAD